MKHLILLMICMACLCRQHLCGQMGSVGVGTGTPHPSSSLDINSSDHGVLIPRMTSAQRDAIMNPATGLLVFVTTDNAFYFFDGTTWITFDSRTSQLTDADHDTRVRVEAVPDEDAIRFSTGGTEYFRMKSGRLDIMGTGFSTFIGGGAGMSDDLSNNENVFVGYESGKSNINGRLNTAIGVQSLYNMTSDANTAVGYRALYTNVSGAYNTAMGYNSLFSNTGSYNTAVGYLAMVQNTDGVRNTATGYMALRLNTGGDWNTATGVEALYNNNSGNYNTAVGARAMYQNTNGQWNTAVGWEALKNNTTGTDNSALGYNALAGNSTGYSNTAAGRAALGSNQTGYYNVATGAYALYFNSTGYHNTGSGYYAGLRNVSGSRSTFIGAFADIDTTGGVDSLVRAMALGYNAKVGCSNCAVIGGIGSDTVHVGIGTRNPAYTLELGGSGTAAKPGGGMWTSTSDYRLKRDITDYSDGLDIVMQIHPVRYHYIEEAGYNSETEYIGVIAQELQEHAPYMVGTFEKDQQDYLAVDPSAFTYMLMNAVREQQAMIEVMQGRIEELSAQLGLLQSKVDR